MQGSIEEWLQLLRLEEYIQPLIAQGYQTVCDVTQLPWEDMEDIGIIRLGHQKKLLLAIKRIKDILSGKWIAPGIASTSHVSERPNTKIPYQKTKTDHNFFWQEFIMSQQPSSLKSHQKDPQTYYDQMFLTQSLPPMSTEHYQQMGFSNAMKNPQQMLKESDDIVLIKV